jgi:diguanylate cyclase (GGDEF)-like protein/PAS domain S-box-containing protein
MPGLAVEASEPGAEPRLAPSGWRARAWIAYLFAILGVSAAALLVDQPIVHGLLNDLTGVGAGIAIAAGTWYHRPRPRLPWVLFAAGVFCYGLADVSYNAMLLAGGIPAFSVGDVFYLAAGTLLAAALAGFASSRGRARRAARMLYVDSAIVFVGAFALLWFLVIDPAVAGGGPMPARVLSGTFPTVDLLLIALAVRLAVTPAFKLTAYRLLLAGIALGSAGDILWRGFSGGLTGAWVSGSYYLCYSVLGAAGLHPSMADLARLVPRLDSNVSVRRLVVVSSAMLAVPLAFVVHVFTSPWHWIDTIIFAAAFTAIPVLIVYRLIDLVAYSRNLAEEATRSSARIAAVLDATPLPVRVLDAAGEVLFVNEAASRWLASGLFREEALDDRGRDARTRGLAGEPLDGAEVSLTDSDGETRQVQVWTAPIHAHDELEAVVAVFADVTEQQQREERVRFLAEHDPVTGLLNRRGFQFRLEQALNDDRGSSTLAILDVDNFKLVNDSAGHPVGDAVLAGLAHELASVLRTDDVLARLSGDEFAVLLAGTGSDQAAPIVERLLRAARKFRLVTNEISFSVTTSIGICELGSGTSSKEALARADIALYEAKQQGRNRIVVWNHDEERSALRVATLDWSTRIKDALDERRFVVYLQPIVELATGEVVQYEALARLRDEDGSISLPGAFIPPAGRLGLMPSIDRMMLDQTVALLEGQPTLRISVNLDAASFEDDGLLDTIEHALARSEGLAGRLGIEITEHTSLRDTARAHRRLERLKELGCTLAIDDFGTGFASFAHLHDLPADAVKISQNLVENVDSDPTAAALVDAIVTVSRALGKEVVAEGVETEQVAAALRAADVRYAQGYLFGAPAPAAAVATGSAQAPRAA